MSFRREQKYLLHNWSDCSHRHRPQSAPRVLAQARYTSRRVNRGARDWYSGQVCRFVRLLLSSVWIATESGDTFLPRRAELRCAGDVPRIC
jgi:hypothetical protein